MSTDTPRPQRPIAASGPVAPPHGPRPRRRRGKALLAGLAGLAALAAIGVLALLLQPGPADGEPVAGVTTVGMRDSAFDPPVIQVVQGETVTWTFDDADTKHNVTGEDWESPNQASGTFEHTFDEPGSYPYSCTLHFNMDGRVEVVAERLQ